jgi:hypothetical protein
LVTSSGSLRQFPGRETGDRRPGKPFVMPVSRLRSPV